MEAEIARAVSGRESPRRKPEFFPVDFVLKMRGYYLRGIAIILD
jgi:hypothetical protein